MTIDNTIIKSIDRSDSPRNIRGIGYESACEYLLRVNSIRAFFHDHLSDKLRDCIIRRYINNKDVKTSIINYLETHKSSYGYEYKFLYYSLKFTSVRNFFIKCYKEFNTWEIANELGINQTTVNRLINNLGIERRFRSSKIHLSLKPIVEEILGFKTETEKCIPPYRVDEFCAELNLCIEFDAEWCHDKEYDDKRDKYLNSLGVSVVRIPVDSSISDIRSLLNSYVK